MLIRLSYFPLSFRICCQKVYIGATHFKREFPKTVIACLFYYHMDLLPFVTLNSSLKFVYATPPFLKRNSSKL